MVVAQKAMDISTPYKLTNGDLELIKQLCLPYKIICQNLGISQIALRLRVKRLADKMGVENRVAMVIKVIRLELVSEKDMVIREYNADKNLLRKNN